MIIRFCAFLLLLTGPTSLAADWRLASSEVIGVYSGVSHLKKTVSLGDTPLTLHLALFDSKQHDIRVIDAGAPPANTLEQAMKRHGCIAGVNGGYFHPDYRPVGLMIADGAVVHRQERARLLSGVLAANRRKIYLLRPPEFRLGPNTRQALQAGPFLIDRGQAVGGLSKARQARRTVVAKDSGTTWALLSTSPVTLADLAQVLSQTDLFPELRTDRALNLDGGSSTAFWFKNEDEPFYLREFGPVRNYIGVVQRPDR